MATVPSPNTWNSGDTPTGSLMNRDSRDGWNFFANPPRVKVYSSTGQAIVASGILTGDTALLWDTEVYDSDGMHSTSSNTSRLTVVTGGSYQVVCHINWTLDNAASAGNRYLGIKENANAVATPRLDNTISNQLGNDITHILPSDGLGPQTLHCSFTCFFNVGDYIEAVVGSSSTNSKSTIVGGAAIRSFFQMRWVSAT